jgi:excisionase family DNA binding protein
MARTWQPPSELITLQEAAELLKVHYMTAYRWVRKGELPALKTGGRLRIRVADLEQFLSERELDVAVHRNDAGQTNWERHVERFVGTLLQGDGAQAAADVRKVIADGATAGDVYVSLIAPALHRIGRAYTAGEITIAEEHRATEICVAIVAQLGELFRRRRTHRGAAVTLTPPNERHAIASAMVADFLRGAGYEVHHLGAGVPARDLAMFLQVVPADVVCFSVTQGLAPDEYRELVDACREGSPTVVFGGQGVDEAAATDAGAVVVRDLADLADALAAR